MWRTITATCLFVLAMGSTDRDEAGIFYYLMPLMVLFAVALTVDAARPEPCPACRARVKELGGP